MRDSASPALPEIITLLAGPERLRLLLYAGLLTATSDGELIEDLPP